MFVAWRDLRFAKGRFTLMGTVVVLITLLVGLLSGLTAGLARENISAITGLPADRLAFAAPPLTRYEPVEEPLLERLAAGLGLARTEVLDASWLVNGPEWVGLRLADADRVLALGPELSRLSGFIGVVGPYPAGQEAQFEVRAFIPGGVVPEDPVTGSLNAGLAQWLMDSGQAGPRYVAGQGRAVGADGRVHIERRADGLWVGGRVREVVVGTVDL